MPNPLRIEDLQDLARAKRAGFDNADDLADALEEIEDELRWANATEAERDRIVDERSRKANARLVRRIAIYRRTR